MTLPQIVNQGIQLAAIEGPKRWIIAAAVFCCGMAALSWAQSIVLSRLQKWASSTGADWDDELVTYLGGPFRLLAIIASFAMASPLLPPDIVQISVIKVVIKASLVITGTWIAERFITVGLRHKFFAGELSETTRALVATISRLGILGLSLLAILDTFGISITPILASLGVGSVAVALALQDTLSNFFSGLYLMADKPLRLGDFVKTENGTEGYVAKIGWRSTHIRMLSNNVVVIPNSKIAASGLTNYDLPEQDTSVIVPVGVAYGSDLEKVERVTVEAAREVLKKVPGAVSTFEPLVRYHTFGDSSIDFSVVLRAAHYVDNYLLKHEFIKTLHSYYLRENIEIPFPQRVIHVLNESKE